MKHGERLDITNTKHKCSIKISVEVICVIRLYRGGVYGDRSQQELHRHWFFCREDQHGVSFLTLILIQYIVAYVCTETY